MTKGIFVIGTDTGVGKTVVSAGLLRRLRTDGCNACYFKPVLSGALCVDGKLIPGDTQFVKQASGLNEEVSNITPYIFKTAVSPHLAAELEKRKIDPAVILEKYAYLKSQYDYILAEGCGGLAVPLTTDGYMLYDLIKALGMSCLVVARAGLGTINHTLLTVRYAQSLGIPVKGIIVNNYTQGICEADNLNMIQTLSGIPVIATVPHISGVDTEKQDTVSLLHDLDALPNIAEFMDTL